MKKRLLILTFSCIVLFNSLFTGAFAAPATSMPSADLISAKSAVLIDEVSGRVLFEKNSHDRHSIASIAKIMTMDIIMDAIKSGKISVNDLVKVSLNAEGTGGSQVWLKVGEKFTVDELLKSIAVHSANDSCVALAEHISGSESEFVNKMNEKVALLQLKDTKFSDCNGLNDDDQYSSAYDVSVIAMDLIKNHPDIKKYTMIWADTFRDGTMTLNNTNKLLHTYTGMYGIKTGTTDKAGNCLCAGVERNGTNLISVVLGAKTSEMRFADTKLILDYGYDNFEKVELAKKDSGPVGSVTVKRTLNSKAEAFYKNDLLVIMQKGQGAVKKEIKYIDNLQAPIA
ncbi:MAG TPA: D-alanyl-D-alanine carboxypeptidase family protein, partial [Clostridia bacterium]|nr:D-alanyl-D-alanine carboxypeptidase family protein [Clostridia bacterium]